MIAGGQFNPAVTLGVIGKVWFNKSGTRKQYLELTLYIAVQFIGAILGAFFAYAITNDTFEFEINSDYSLGGAIAIEVLITSILVCNALIVGDLEESTLMSTMSIPVSVIGGVLLGGHISGGCMNPFACFALNFFHALLDEDNTI
mmetsp:Transcript_15906/g.2635  ORF Transcript_15906/g.2635 Transcript_15906/m.2635 type:complete len:145 (+) Transcript_15906:145-579(+)